jgi:hypothetical protein
MASVWNGGEDNLLPPDWWSVTGYKRPKVTSETEFLIRMEEPSGSFEIYRQHNRGYPWRVSWRKRLGLTGEVTGHVDFSPEELQAAFGLADQCPIPLPLKGVAEDMLARLDATIVFPGKFVRAGRYLSIPDIASVSGVPTFNVAIHLEDYIVAVVNRFIIHHERPAFY